MSQAPVGCAPRAAGRRDPAGRATARVRRTGRSRTGRGGTLDVLRHLRHAAPRPCRTLGGPQPLDELQDDALAVEVEVGAVQDVGLDPALGAVEGRVGADRDGGRQGAVGVVRLGRSSRTSQPA